MVEAVQLHSLYLHTFIFYTCKVFEHVHMLWIGIWVHLCTVTLLAIKLNQIWVMWGWWGETMTC
jgi:hypothetical protein